MKGAAVECAGIFILGLREQSRTIKKPSKWFFIRYLSL